MPDQEHEKAFPEALLESMAMPLAAEYRGFGAWNDSINKGAFEGPWHTTLANLYGVSRREIEQRETKRRTARSLQIFMAILLTLVVAGGWRLYETHRSGSLELAAKSTQASTEGLYDRALRFAVLATRSTWLGTEVSESELSRAAYASPYVGLLKGHDDYVWAATFSPDGTKIVTASKDHTARLWDVVTGEMLTTFTGHEESVQAAAFSPDGTKVVTASDDKTARLWDVATGKHLMTLTGHDEAIQAVAVSPNGTKIVTASGDHNARLWDAITGETLTTLTGHDGPVKSAAFSPDGTKILTASDDKTARLWDTATGQTLTTLSGHDGVIHTAAFSPNGTKILTASDDYTARLWDAASGEMLMMFAGHEGAVRAAAFGPNGTRIVTGIGRQHGSALGHRNRGDPHHILGPSRLRAHRRLQPGWHEDRHRL